MLRTYTTLIKLPTFRERFEYLKLDGIVAEETFGAERILNQTFYRSPEWKKVRDYVIVRDLGCDLGLDGFEIFGTVFVHHMNPIDPKSIIHRDEAILDPNQLICCSFRTHNAIHYGDIKYLEENTIVERKPNDTCPWRNSK